LILFSVNICVSSVPLFGSQCLWMTMKKKRGFRTFGQRRASLGNGIDEMKHCFGYC